jgi:hypothetical protein
MGSEPIAEERKIEKTIKNMPRESFTVLDLIETRRTVYPEG